MLQPKNIYIADDDADDIDFFKEALDRIIPDCTLHVFNDGQDIVDQLLNTTELPDLVILDINMPRLNGLEALVKIKNVKPLSTIPIAVLSTSCSKSSILTARNNGANLFIAKPYEFHEWVRKVELILKSVWLQKEYSFIEDVM